MLWVKKNSSKSTRSSRYSSMALVWALLGPMWRRAKSWMDDDSRFSHAVDDIFDDVRNLHRSVTNGARHMLDLTHRLYMLMSTSMHRYIYQPSHRLRTAWGRS